MRETFRKLIKGGIIATVVLLVLGAFPATISAEGETTGQTIGEYGITMDSPVLFDFDPSTYDSERSDIPLVYTVDPVNTVRTAYYPNAFTYYDGTKYSVKVEVKYLGENKYKAAGDKAIEEGGGKEHKGIKLSNNIVVLGAFGLSYDVKFTFYSDSNFETTAQVYAAISFEDPDQSNYLFEGANTKTVYYKNVKDKDRGGTMNLKDNYTVESGGIMHVNVGADDDKYNSWANFAEGVFGVLLNDETSFEYTVQGKQDNLAVLADLIKVHVPYNVEYYYEVEGEYPETPDFTKGPVYVDIYEEPTVSVTTADKTPNPIMGEGYVLDTDKNQAWTLDVKPDGSTVLKVYFNLPYTIKYNPNCTDSEGTMDPDNYKGTDETMPSKTTWVYTRPGHDFLGYKPENKGDIIYTEPQDFKSILLEEEDREIELFAQWDPWKYTIKYDPNGGKGEMPDHQYTYDDPTMNSDPNKFKRTGYSFAGFTYTDEKGNVTTYKHPSDFRDILVELGKNSEITLVAQWVKIPDTPSYVAPVTGIE